MNGISTGNTLVDLLILVGIPALAFLANRYGLTAVLVLIGEQLVKLKPAPKPDEPQPVAPVSHVATVADVKPVALEWIALIQLLLPLILQIIESFRQKTGRVPTSAELAEILASGKADEFTPVEMPTVARHSE